MGTARPGERLAQHNLGMENFESQAAVGPANGMQPSELTLAYYYVGDSTDWQFPLKPMAADVTSDGKVRLVEQIRLPFEKFHPNDPSLRKFDEFQILHGLDWDHRLFPAGGSEATIWIVNTNGAPSRAQEGEPEQ